MLSFCVRVCVMLCKKKSAFADKQNNVMCLEYLYLILLSHGVLCVRVILYNSNNLFSKLLSGRN